MTNIIQEAHAYTEEALALTERNKEKTYDTKVVMEDVLKVVSELVNN